MAIVSCAYFDYPKHMLTCNGITISPGGITLDADSEGVGMVFRVPKTGNITSISFYVSSVTTAGDLTGGIYLLDTSGVPTTTLYGGCVATVLNIASTDTKTLTFSTPCSATVGNLVCAKMLLTPFVAGKFIISNGVATGGSGYIVPGLSYATSKTGASWATYAGAPTYSITYDDGTCGYIPGSVPIFDSGYNEYNLTAGVGDEAGIKFTSPLSMRIVGVEWNSYTTSTINSIYLYDSANNVLASAVNYAKSAANNCLQYTMFSAPATTTAGSDYRLVIRRVNAGQITIQTWILRDAAAMQQMTGTATGISLTYRTSGGAWTDDATKFPQMYALVDGVDTGSTAASSQIAYSFVS